MNGNKDYAWPGDIDVGCEACGRDFFFPDADGLHVGRGKDTCLTGDGIDDGKDGKYPDVGGGRGVVPADTA